MCNGFSSDGAGAGETCEVSRMTLVRSRRDDFCDVCGTTVRAGTFSVVLSMLYEGRWSHDRIHLQCRNLVDDAVGPYAARIYHSEALYHEDRNIQVHKLEQLKSLVTWAQGGEWQPVDLPEVDE